MENKQEKEKEFPSMPVFLPNALYPMNAWDPLWFDPLGSYTGLTEDPVQDADDL